MTQFKFKVSSQTLKELDELVCFKNKTHREIIEHCVSTYHEEIKNRSVVYPIKEYENSLLGLVESKAPYKVKEEIPSTTGLSSGLVKLENCEIPVPASWLTTKTKQKFSNTFWFVFINLIWIVVTLLV